MSRGSYDPGTRRCCLGKIQHGRPRISLYFAATGAWLDTNGLDAQSIAPTKKTLLDLNLFHQVDFEPVDRERLIKLWNRSRTPVSATFEVKGPVSLPKIDKVTEAYLALVRAQDLVEKVLADEEGRIRSSVFEQNVRAFLGEENEVNARIREALENRGLHDRFAINNNGVTIVASEVKVQSDKVSVEDFQIVNGCQTSHVLFRNREKLSPDVWVPIKLIEAEDAGVVAQLVESTNSQSAVNESQFVSIKPFAQKLEAYFVARASSGADPEDQPLCFERRTNQFAGLNISKLRIFDIPKLARVYASMFLDLPHLAYMYPTQVMAERSAQLFRSDQFEHAYYTAAKALYRLELAFGNDYVPRKYQPWKWHILMLFRHLLVPAIVPTSASKMERYLAPIDAVLANAGRASAPPFLECVKLIERAGTVSRDQRKGLPYTQTLCAAMRGHQRSRRPSSGKK
ncbi:MAG: AIPR family protein [Sandaracinus sp.]